jgi:FtsP/CotA-like multicopper oxidase with cupredoxin domain
VTRGQQYLFRVIGTGALYPWRISVDQHNLTMVAVDSFNITPVVAESFIIAPGERYDFQQRGEVLVC